MHITTANISKMVIDRASIITAIKYEVTHGISICKFRFGLGLIKGQLGNKNGVANFSGSFVNSMKLYIQTQIR